MASKNPLTELSRELAAAAEKGGQAVVAVHGRPRVASSGVLWSGGQGAVVVTTDHTLKRDEDITVTLADGRNLPATLAGRDGGTDLAVLRLEDAAGAVAPQTAAGASLQIGNLVLAIGRRGENGLSASLGVISALSGAWRTWRGGQIDQFIRPDTNIYTGFSGGALVDLEGNVVGVNTSGLARGSAITVPAFTVNRVVAELLAQGHVRRGYLGVGLHPVQLGDSKTGLIVLSLEADGPAAKAGLVVGDVVLSLAGEAVEDTDDVQGHLGAEQVGKPLPVDLLRGGQPLRIEVTPAERPAGGR